jgi:hypothetical protein
MLRVRLQIASYTQQCGANRAPNVASIFMWPAPPGVPHQALCSSRQSICSTVSVAAEGNLGDMSNPPKLHDFGLCLLEALTLRVKDVGLAQSNHHRDPKRKYNRVTMLPRASRS